MSPVQFMDDRVNAMRDYQAALELDPTYSLAYFNAGNVYFHTRQFSQVWYHILVNSLQYIYAYICLDRSIENHIEMKAALKALLNYQFSRSSLRAILSADKSMRCYFRDYRTV